ncbi:MAG: hypothetical protein WCS69_10325 [Ignavibacteriaceae bacterium]|jgi:hypothetical protein
MTDKQENLFSMFTILHGFLKTESTIVGTIPAFQRATGKLEGLIADIQDVDSGRKSIKTGKNSIKVNSKNELASAVFQVANALFTYADDKGVPEIRERVDNTENFYKKMRDTNLTSEAIDLVKLTEGKETELTEHGLTAEEIADVGLKSEAFKKNLEISGTSEGESVNATKTVYELIGEAKDLIDNQIDRFAEKFKTINPDFFTKYTTARRVLELGARSVKKEEPVPPTT